LPIATQLLSLEKRLDYPQFPENSPEKVQDLVDSLQSIRFRLQSLEASYDKAANESPELMQALAPLSEKWRQRVQSVFEQWAHLDKMDTLIDEWSTEASLSHELERQLGELKQGRSTDGIDDRALQNLYAVMGSTQSLLEAMKELGDSMKRINWTQWAVARF
jgi:chromosome segregation ATPase